MDITLIKSELYRQGGLEKYTWQIAADFCALGASVTVLTTETSVPPFSHPLLKLVSLDVKHSLSVLNVLHFDRACHEYLAKHPTPTIFSLDRNRFQTHIRAGNGAHAAYLKQRAVEEGKIKQLSFALNPLHRAILSLEKTGFEHPGLKILFANSHMVKEEITRLYATDPDKIRVVHNGVEWEKMETSFSQWESEKEKTLSTLGLNKNSFQFLFIGHNFQRKGLEKLLRGLSLIKDEDFQLSVVGKEKNLSYFQTLTERLGLARKVFFFGPQQSPLPFYSLADCLVIPSLYDPFANVTVEALAMGLFVLSSKRNGGHEVLTPLNGNILEDLNDASSLAYTLRQAISQKKTPERALSVRLSVKHLDFSRQLRAITAQCIN